MYIKEVELSNVRSIESFKMNFVTPAGWHVIIGDNGAGKSTLIKSIALALIGPKEALGLRHNWSNWLKRDTTEGYVKLHIEQSDGDKHSGRQRRLKNTLIPNIIDFKKVKPSDIVSISEGVKMTPNPNKYNWGHGSGWFSCAFGPFRRFEGGNLEWAKVFYAQPKLGAHLSVFGEDVALGESIEWLVKLRHRQLETNSNHDTLEHIKTLVNSPDFLPHKAHLSSVSSEGVEFKDGNGSLISINELSDGYRSILSMTFELLRQLSYAYGDASVFKSIKLGQMTIDVAGVVLVDEIDAHLHPTWQTRIGEWFTKYFPNMQFIVSTHSPLVCRASNTGSIWQMKNPGSEMNSGELTGVARERLINGNVLDAYGTNAFGENITISKTGSEKIKRMGALNIRSMLGKKVSKKDQDELNKLKEVYPSESGL